MTPEGLFTVALGLGEGWSVKQCSFEGAPPELLLKIDFKPGHRFGCPECGATSPAMIRLPRDGGTWTSFNTGVSLRHGYHE